MHVLQLEERHPNAAETGGGNERQCHTVRYSPERERSVGARQKRREMLTGKRDLKKKKVHMGVQTRYTQNLF